MRVFLATPYPRAQLAGVATFVRTLEATLPGYGATVLVVDPTADELHRPLANLFLALRSMVDLIRQRRWIGVVHGQQLHLQTLAVAAMARTLGKPVVVTVHGRSPRPAGLRGLLLATVEYAGTRIPQKVVFVSEALRSELAMPGDVIPVGVPVTELRAFRAERDQVRMELGVSGSVVIEYVGRVTEDKGIWTLIEAFRRARERAKEPLKLVVVGPNDEVLDQLRERIGDFAGDVLVLGPQERPWRHLAAADLFVLPSLREGLPLSLLEAMAMGIPPIASRVGDIPRLVQHGENGWLVSPGDSRELAELLLQASDDSDLRRRASMLAAESIRSPYTSTAMVESYVRLYERLSDRARAASPS